MTAPAPTETPDQEARRAWMSVLARAPSARLLALWRALGEPPAHELLRAPETGAAMVRGRAGGTGAPFNLGEMSVTRCAVRLAGSGTAGHAYVQGRDREHALAAALMDAQLCEGGAAAARIADEVIAVLEREAEEARAATARRAAATKVEFFTMVRGED